MKLCWLLILLGSVGGVLADVDEATGLEVDTGWLQVRAHCGGCHSYALVTSQRANRQTWLDTIRWMQATQNFWQLAPEIEAEVLDYLTKNYGPQENRRRAPIPPSLLPATTQTVQ